jgi:hypothetical protein
VAWQMPIFENSLKYSIIFHVKKKFEKKSLASVSNFIPDYGSHTLIYWWQKTGAHVTYSGSVWRLERVQA